MIKSLFVLADTIKAAQKSADSAKATASKKFEEAKQMASNLHDKASDTVDEL